MNKQHFAYDIIRLRELTPDFSPCTVNFVENNYVLGIGLTNKCNFCCPMCYYHPPKLSEKKFTYMPLELLRNTINVMPKLRSIILGLEGEPLCYPWLIEALDIIKTKTDSIQIVSNGSLITKEFCLYIKDYPISRIALSIDADNEAAYSIFRKGGNLLTFIKNCKMLVDSWEGNIIFHSVIFNENLQFLSGLPSLAKSIGIKNICFQLLRPHAGSNIRSITPVNDKNLESILNLIIKNSEKNDISIQFDQYFANQRIMKFLKKYELLCKNIKIINYNTNQMCPHISNFTSILSDGSIFPCCGDFVPEKIYDYSFNGIFNHEYLQRLRYVHKRKIKLLPCKKCIYY